jgi:hypothetical protein
MTTRKSFKRLVHPRMDKTGESYTAARAALPAAVPVQRLYEAFVDQSLGERRRDRARALKDVLER